MISQEQKVRIVEFITANFGILINPEQWFELESKIKNACLELHISDWESFTKSIPSLNPKGKELETLACHLSVGETYFFRESKALDLFRDEILPSLLLLHSNKKSFTLWSAGCCSGEEPYTLAMIIREAVPNIHEWDIKIIASDINPVFLNKALVGQYTPWSFRNTPEWAMKKYFKKLDKKFEIDASIREMVEFKQLNLVDETAFPSSEFKPWSIDVIFCRNVFIYFPTEQIQNVTCRFKRCLTEGGWLITSPVEVSNEGLKSLRYEWHPGVGVLRKDSSIASEKLQNTTCSHQKTSTENISNTSQIKNTVLAYQHSSKSTNHTPASEIDLLLEKATIAFENGQYCVASGHIKSILKQRKNHMDASILQARIFANLGDHNGALIVLKNLLKRHTENAYIYYLLANTYAEMEQKNMAEQSARQALYLDPDMISAQFLMGNIMQAQGNSRASKKHYKNLMQLLSRYEKDELLPELDGMTTGALYEIVNCLL